MSLITNSLFLDSEYESDCKFKINYLSLVDDDTSNDKEVDTPSGGDFNITKENLDTRVILNSLRVPVYDGERYHTTKKISDNYLKIIIEVPSDD